MANRIPVAEEEGLIEYIIEAIPDTYLQNQARLQKFQTKSAVLEAFKEIVLPKNGTKNAKTEQTTVAKEVFLQIKQPRKCFRCYQEGHMKAECMQPPRERGVCFICRAPDHIARDCPKKTKENQGNNVHNVDEDKQPEDDVFKNVINNLNVEGKINSMRLRTLLDSGSPISFVKLKYILSDAIIVKENDLEIKFHSNQSDLVVFGTINVDICINNRLVSNLCLIVVPDFTMETPVVLGRDILNVLGFRQVQKPQESINI